MPYVKQERRDELDNGATPQDTGDVTYLLTRVIDNFLAAHPMRFERFAQALGALEASKLELYRRGIGPYEDTKIAENGDVYTAELVDLLGER